MAPVMLPLSGVTYATAVQNSHASLPAANTRGYPILKGVRVLLVEDYPDTRDLMRFILEHSGAVVTVADSARDALAVLEHARPMVLVSDIAMPGEDGYWLMREIVGRHGDAGPRIPAVAITAHGREYSRPRTLLAGFQAYLTKPVVPEDLCATVAGVIAASQRRASL